MSKPVVEVQVRAVIPTSGGCAVFLGNEEKVFVIYVEQSVGAAITMFMRGTQKERPLTHDLLAHILRALGARGRVIINDLKRGHLFARRCWTEQFDKENRRDRCATVTVSQWRPANGSIMSRESGMRSRT
jgi:bifunctional DNase/RNase